MKKQNPILAKLKAPFKKIDEENKEEKEERSKKYEKIKGSLFSTGRYSQTRMHQIALGKVPSHHVSSLRGAVDAFPFVTSS